MTLKEQQQAVNANAAALGVSPTTTAALAAALQSIEDEADAVLDEVYGSSSGTNQALITKYRALV